MPHRNLWLTSSRTGAHSFPIRSIMNKPCALTSRTLLAACWAINSMSSFSVIASLTLDCCGKSRPTKVSRISVNKDKAWKKNQFLSWIKCFEKWGDGGKIINQLKKKNLRAETFYSTTQNQWRLELLGSKYFWDWKIKFPKNLWVHEPFFQNYWYGCTHA